MMTCHYEKFFFEILDSVQLFVARNDCVSLRFGHR